MTNEQKRIKIAEACGWNLVSDNETQLYSWSNPSIKHRIKWMMNKDMASQSVIPDYFGDLNAIHEAENVLNDTQHSNYRGELLKVCLSLADALCATAAQRAEAFGLALGLWEEGE